MTRGKHQKLKRPNIKDFKLFEASDLEKITREEGWKYFGYQFLCGWHKQPLYWQKTQDGKYMFMGTCAVTGQQCIYTSPYDGFVPDYVCGMNEKLKKQKE